MPNGLEYVLNLVCDALYRVCALIPGTASYKQEKPVRVALNEHIKAVEILIHFEYAEYRRYVDTGVEDEQAIEIARRLVDGARLQAQADAIIDREITLWNPNNKTETS